MNSCILTISLSHVAIVIFRAFFIKWPLWWGSREQRVSYTNCNLDTKINMNKKRYGIKCTTFYVGCFKMRLNNHTVSLDCPCTLQQLLSLRLIASDRLIFSQIPFFFFSIIKISVWNTRGVGPGTQNLIVWQNAADSQQQIALSLSRLR